MRILLVVLLLAAAACAGPEPSVTVGGRTVAVHHPESAGEGAPLVIVLHGAGGTGARIRADTGWDDLADREGLVVAYPDGLDHVWNAGSCCGSSARTGVDDVGWLHDLAAALTGRERTGPVYAVGFSNGAMLAYTWACARPGDLAGIGAVAGALTAPCAAPAPLAVAAVAGTADDRVPVGGRPGRPGLDATLAPFLAAGGCTAPTDAVDGRATVTTWDCAAGAVIRDVLAGQPHTWAAPPTGPGSTTAPDDATGWIWSVLGQSG